jgi:hypothetical protein
VEKRDWKMKKKKLTEKDKKLKEWLKQGGREGTKQDFLTLLKRAVPSKA